MPKIRIFDQIVALYQFSTKAQTSSSEPLKTGIFEPVCPNCMRSIPSKKWLLRDGCLYCKPIKPTKYCK